MKFHMFPVRTTCGDVNIEKVSTYLCTKVFTLIFLSSSRFTMYTDTCVHIGRSAWIHNAHYCHWGWMGALMDHSPFVWLQRNEITQLFLVPLTFMPKLTHYWEAQLENPQNLFDFLLLSVWCTSTEIKSPDNPSRGDDGWFVFVVALACSFPYCKIKSRKCIQRNRHSLVFYVVRSLRLNWSICNSTEVFPRLFKNIILKCFTWWDSVTNAVEWKKIVNLTLAKSNSH